MTTDKNSIGRSAGTALGLFAALAASLGLAATSQAQQVEEIMVTARKVEERLQDVPLAISAFSEQDIESARISDLKDIANLTPGLQFYNALGGALPTPIIRGIAPTDIRAKETNAAIFVDGVYVSGREGLNFSQLDVERIEVVKGPQSALYGRNAFSGAINFVTKRPSDIFEVKSSVTAGNRGKLAANGSVSGPLVEGILNGRLGVSYDDWDGSYDDTAHNQDVGGYKYRSIQGSLLFTPMESLDILAQGYYSNDEIDDSATRAIQANCEDGSIYNPRLQVPHSLPIWGNYCGEIPSVSGNDIPKAAGAIGGNRELIRASLNISWEIGTGTIGALSGYSSTQNHSTLDFSRLGDTSPLIYCTPLFDGTNCFTNDARPLELKRFFTGVLDREGGGASSEFSQELRYTSALSEPFRYSGGVYFYDVHDEDSPGQPFITAALPADLVPRTDATLEDPGIGQFCPCQQGNFLSPFGQFLFVTDPGFANTQIEESTDTRSWAGFASAELDFLEHFTVRGETRYTYEEKTYKLYGVPDFAYGDTTYPLRDPTPTIGKNDWAWVSGRVTLDYKPNESWMIYSSLANASKSGGYTGASVAFLDPVSSAIGPNVNVVQPYDPEKNWTVEVGVKGRSSDRRIGVDLSMYRIDWTNIVLPQVLTEFVDPTDGILKRTSQILTLSANTGDAVVWGWELLTDVVISEDWKASLGVAYTDATWGTARQATYQFFPSFYVPNPDPNGPPLGGDISGNQLLRVSPWTVNGTVQYRHPVSDHWEFYGRGDVSWKDSWYIGNDNQGTVPANTLVNLRLGVESGRYTVELWANNLLDNGDPVGAFRDIFWTNTQDLQSVNNPPTSSLADFPPIRLSVNQPDLRTFGLTARVRFGGAEK